MNGQAVTVVARPQTGPVGLNHSRLARWCLYALMSFPIVDYALRFGPLHILGVVWDKVVFLILLALAASRYIAGYRPQRLTWTRFAIWFILLGLGIMFAGFASALVSVQGYRIDVYYIVIALLVPFVVDREDVPKLLHVGAMVAILIAVHGIYQYIVKVPIPRGWVDVTESVRTRVYSVLQSPNELGSYMALMTPIVAGLAVYEKDKWRKWLYAAGAPLCGITMVFTSTRGAWVSLAIAIFIMSVLFERRLLLALIVLGVVGFFLPPVQHRIGELLSPVYWMQATASGRIFRWMTAYDKMATNPLFGIGTGRFGGAVASLSYGAIYSDNYYAKTLAETGLVGLTLFVAMHLALIRDILKRAVGATAGRRRFVYLGGMTGLIAVLIHNAMENVFEFAPMEVAYFMYATLLLIWTRQPNEPDAADTVGVGTGGQR